MDCSGMSQSAPPWNFCGHTCTPPGPLLSYFQPRAAAVGSSPRWPSRQGVRPPISSLR